MAYSGWPKTELSQEKIDDLCKRLEALSSDDVVKEVIECLQELRYQLTICKRDEKFSTVVREVKLRNSH